MMTFYELFIKIQTAIKINLDSFQGFEFKQDPDRYGFNSYIEFKNSLINMIEYHYLICVLKRNKHNVSKTSRELVMDKRNLFRLIKRYGIKREFD